MQKFKLTNIINIKRAPCKTCVTYIYTVPSLLDYDIEKCIESFGRFNYDIKNTNIVSIEDENGFKIHGKIKNSSIKFIAPLKYELNHKDRQNDFEIMLASWLEKKLDIIVEV